MKKEDITGTIVYLLFLALGFVFVFTILRNHSADSLLGNTGYVFFNLGAFVAGIIFNAVFFEVAHIIGALVGGYSIVSVNILHFCWKKDNGKFKFSFSSFDGFTGETKIVPKENAKKEANPYPYLLFGSIFFIIEVIAVTTVFSMFRTESGAKGNIAYFLLTMGVVGAMIFIYNILPFQLDEMTDGYRLTKVTNPKNRQAFNELLKVDYDVSQGKQVEVKVFEEVTNYTSDINLNKAYARLNQNDFAGAEEILNTIIESRNTISYNVYIRAKAQKIYINIINNDLENALKYYDSDVPVSERRDICDDNTMPCIRAYILMAGLLDKSRSECVIAINKVGKAYKKTAEPIKEIEKTLFNEALKKVNEAHPKWELDKFYIE